MSKTILSLETLMKVSIYIYSSLHSVNSGFFSRLTSRECVIVIILVIHIDLSSFFIPAACFRALNLKKSTSSIHMQKQSLNSSE